MTDYLAEAFRVAARLPPYEQAELAGRILADVMASEGQGETEVAPWALPDHEPLVRARYDR